ncbi:glycosyltransferase family 4 protein [Candidatus Pacearchaeota archaeon]|nr:glycosyltransferase family 4 protein [Candidatus Pacearchaeota archaeon]
MNKKKICFMTITKSPKFLGGYSLYHKNLIRYIKENHQNLDISWVYFGDKNRTYFKEGIKYFELKSNKLQSFMFLGRFILLAKFFTKNYFDVINTIGGPWTFLYKKKKGQKIIHTFHGTTYYFNKNHFKRFNLLQKILFSPLLLISLVQERPHKEADKIICVSEKVKRQVKNLYGSELKSKISVVRTGVNLKNFKLRDKKTIRKKLNLDLDKTYGLYVGGGGYWTKGLDRIINLSKEIYKLNKNYRLLVIGPDLKKTKHLINEKFVIYMKEVERKKMPLYYNASDVFFCMSRYEGGAPTLVVSEAMASGCLLVCSKDSEQEIIKDGKNGLIVEEFGKIDSKKILDVLKDKKKKENIIKNSIKTIKEISLEKWGEKTMNVLLK